MEYKLNINNKEFAVDIGEIKGEIFQVKVNGQTYSVRIETPEAPSPPSVLIKPVSKTPPASAGGGPAVSRPGSGAVIAPLPGLILEIKVHQGDSVIAGQVIATMEAMKMENNLIAPVSGIVREILVQKGAEIKTGEVIMQIG